MEFLLLAALLGQLPPGLGAPEYTPESIANSAANVSGLYAPNTFISIYGRNLAYETKAISSHDIGAGMLPSVLYGTGVRVLLTGIFAHMYYVSPQQVNILVPNYFKPGRVTLQLVNEGYAGPPVEIQLEATAPALFEYEGRVIATHLDGSLVAESAPAERGEIVVLWATGLGPVNPAAKAGSIPTQAAWLADRDRFEVLVNGEPVPRDHIYYAGVAPGFAGLYQINVRMPEEAAPDPEIRVGTVGRFSPGGRVLTLR